MENIEYTTTNRHLFQETGLETHILLACMYWIKWGTWLAADYVDATKAYNCLTYNFPMQGHPCFFYIDGLFTPLSI